jgi:hypothetical protein
MPTPPASALNSASSSLAHDQLVFIVNRTGWRRLGVGVSIWRCGVDHAGLDEVVNPVWSSEGGVSLLGGGGDEREYESRDERREASSSSLQSLSSSKLMMPLSLSTKEEIGRIGYNHVSIGTLKADWGGTYTKLRRLIRHIGP